MTYRLQHNAVRPKPAPVVVDSKSHDLKLKEWAAANHTTVSRIPRCMVQFLTCEEEAKLEEKGMNVDDLLALLSRWLPSRAAPTMHINNYHYVSSCQTLRFVDALEDGEIEHQIGRVDGRLWSGAHMQWPAGSKWRLRGYIENTNGPDFSSAAWIMLYLKDLPKQLQSGIQWRHKNCSVSKHYMRRSDGQWYYYTTWKDTETDCAWEAHISIRNTHRYSDDFSFPTSLFRKLDSIIIEQRIGDSSRKFVVISNSSWLYGNDLLSHKTQVWESALHEQTMNCIEKLYS
ncbi:hypothetical protein CGLO_00051 [Colletotrichum gloeosporioides Cg-14]|uniref:Uncharacterized protein n=1 Tax=Colletotrichum gloeosporioides (strain Cg-14) TaxID=1237896 RepID=T0KVH9_COLGC|nr:hypothetical protein CGLO_00051 [Colletotrichum gloeosporioides Cg-14]